MYIHDGVNNALCSKQRFQGTVLNPVNDILTTDDDDVDIYDDVSYHALPKKNEANKVICIYLFK